MTAANAIHGPGQGGAAWKEGLPAWLRRGARSPYSFVVLLVIGLLAGNLAALPQFAEPSQWPAELGLLAPMVLVAMATTPSVLSGGMDISVGPLANLVAIVFGVTLLPHGLGSPAVAIPVCLAIGLGVGTVNGVLVAVLRYQPIVATLCTFIILGGVNLMLAPSATSLPGNWTDNLAGQLGPVPGGLVLIAVAGLAWLALGRFTSYHRALYAVGGYAPAAYSAGTSVAKVRVASYAAGGLLAGLAGLALIGLVESADPTYGQQYALIGIAAVALGGASLRGGQGSLTGSALGAAAIFLAQNLMLAAHVSTLWVQVVYGGFLMLAVTVNASLGPLRRAGGAA